MTTRPGKQATTVPISIPKRQPLAPELVDQIVDMYGAKVEGTNQPRYTYAEITRATHVPRGTIIYYLKQRGIAVDRLGPGRAVASNQVDLLDRLTASERECGELRAKCDRLQATLDTLLDRLGITPAAAARALKPETRRGSRA